MKSATNKLQEDLTQQRIITETISEENINMKKITGDLQDALRKKDEETRNLKMQIEELEPMKDKVEFLYKSWDDLTKKTIETINTEIRKLTKVNERKLDG